MPIVPILEAIAILLAALCAPAWVMLRVRRLDGRTQAAFHRLLKSYRKRGYVLRYEGESDAIVRARIDRIEWIAHDAPAACRHMLRRYGSPVMRARMGEFVSPGSAPPALPVAPLAAGPVAPAPDDTS